jgi:hypothetical protein
MSEQYIEWVALAEADSAENSENSSQLEKFAQRRGFLDWLHEKVNVPRRMAETFSTIYGDVMNTLRDVDDRIRREYAVNLRNYIKDSKKALKERRYLDIVHFLSSFDEDLKKIADQGKLLHQLRGEQIDDFYGDNMYYDWGRDYFKTASVKTAGIMDFFQPMKRQMAGRILERMYHNTLRTRHRGMEELINEAHQTANFVFDRLKHMGAARARGDVSDYLKQLDEIAKRRQRFSNLFRQKYDSEIRPMVERMREERGKMEESKVQPEPTAPAQTTPSEPQQLSLPFTEPSAQLSLPFGQKARQAPAPIPAPAPAPAPEPAAAEPTAEPLIEVTQEPAAAALPELPSEIAIETEQEVPQAEVAPPAPAPAPAPAKAPAKRKPAGKAPTRRAPPKPKQVAPPEPPAPAGTQRKRPSRKTVQQVAKAIQDDSFALTLLKQAKDQKSKETLRDMLLVFSAELDEIDEVEASLKCMAIAEGLLDG